MTGTRLEIYEKSTNLSLQQSNKALFMFFATCFQWKQRYNIIAEAIKERAIVLKFQSQKKTKNNLITLLKKLSCKKIIPKMTNITKSWVSELRSIAEPYKFT